MVDIWSKWVEAFPTSKADASAVARTLLSEIIPRWGIPQRLSSDNGSHFGNEAITQVSHYLGIDIRKHCAYHPASEGAVERENGSLKSKLVKCCEETGLPWTKALPITLVYLHMRKRERTNMSPFEIFFAAPPQVGMAHPEHHFWTQRSVKVLIILVNLLFKSNQNPCRNQTTSNCSPPQSSGNTTPYTPAWGVRPS